MAPSGNIQFIRTVTEVMKISISVCLVVWSDVITNTSFRPSPRLPLKTKEAESDSKVSTLWNSASSMKLPKHSSAEHYINEDLASHCRKKVNQIMANSSSTSGLAEIFHLQELGAPRIRHSV
jgi:hypothetical protein